MDSVETGHGLSVGVGEFDFQSDKTDRYVASPPSVALAALAVQREEELRRAQRVPRNSTPASSACCSPLMDLVSADTRLQLGFRAARRGWI